VATRRTPDTRAKNSDRTDTCQVLDSALADGQLSMAEHQQRVSAATNAATLGELQSLVSDLQTSGPAQFVAAPPKSRRGPVVIATITGMAVVISGAIAWAVMAGGDSTPETASSAPSSGVRETHALAAEPAPQFNEQTEEPADPPAVVLDPHQNLQSAEGLARVIDETRKRFGDTMGYELAVMRDEALLARPDPSDDSSKLIYTFRGGWGDPYTQSRSDTDDLTDLGAFDVPAAAAALQNAPATLQIAPGDVSDTSLDIDYIADPAGPGALELLVKVTTNAGTNGWIYLDGATKVKRVVNPSLHLRSSTWRQAIGGGVHQAPVQKTAISPIPAKYWSARSPRASSRWRNTGSG
jgi:hypothetical protein